MNRRVPLAVLVAVVVARATAFAQPGAPAAGVERTVTASGYLQPTFGVTHLPDATPRDRWQAGLESSAAGIEIHGTPFEAFSFVVHAIVGDGSFDAVARVTAVDGDEDGNVDAVETETSPVLGVALEEASVAYRPFDGLLAKAGRMRVPFTAQHQSPATALLFRTRSGANDAFLSGPDHGLLLTYLPDSEVVRAAVGVFNGDRLSESPSDERGIAYALRADLHPLGAFPFDEFDHERGGLRVGIGAGLLYHPTMRYDETGFGGRRVDDLRLAASLRAAYRGAYLQGELLRRHARDRLLDRPEAASGGYLQAAWLLPLGLEPAARIGATVEDRETSPRRVEYQEAGLTWYPRHQDERIDSLKISAQYRGEDRVTEEERADGFTLGVQLLW